MRLHEVVDLALVDAPPSVTSVDEIVRKGRKVQRRRRATFAGAGAALAVAAVSAGALVLPSARETPPAQVATSVEFPVPANPFTWTYGAYDIGRWHVAAPQVVSTAYQISAIYRDGLVTDDQGTPPTADLAKKRVKELNLGHGKRLYAFLVVYRPGAFDPATLPSAAEKLTVEGHQARIFAGSPGTKADGHRILAWEYSANAWAVADIRSEQSKDPSNSDMKELVRGLRPTASIEATVPFTVGYVPAGYRAVELGSHAMSGMNGIAMARENDYGGAVYTNQPPATTGLSSPFGGVGGDDLPGSFQIFVVPTTNTSQQDRSTDIKCGNGFCTTHSADGDVVIQVASEGRLSDAEMTKVIQGLRLADVKNDKTWPTATAGLGL